MTRLYAQLEQVFKDREFRVLSITEDFRKVGNSEITFWNIEHYDGMKLHCDRFNAIAFIEHLEESIKEVGTESLSLLDYVTAPEINNPNNLVDMYQKELCETVMILNGKGILEPVLN